MDIKEVATYFSFADAEFKSLEEEDKRLTVYLLSWEEKILKVIFINILQFRLKSNDVIQDLCEIIGDTPFLREALSRHYVSIPEKHPFKFYQIRDIDDFPFLEVVAESIQVFEED